MAVKLKKPDGAKIAIDMTPMIDIVFQLLTFFIMTLKIASAEGDFNIKMPLAAPRAGPPDPNALPPMKLYLKSDAAGNCSRVVLNEQEFSGDERWTRLHNQIAGQIDPGSITAASQEIELVCDYNLHYEHVIAAITAVSGEVRDGQVIKLIEKIKFSPPTAP